MKCSPCHLNCLGTKVQFLCPCRLGTWASHPRTWRDTRVNKFMGRMRGFGEVLEAAWWSPCLLGEGSGVPGD